MRHCLSSTEGIPERQKTGRNNHQPGTHDDWPFWSIGYLTLLTEVLLVAVNGHQYRTVLQFMHFVPSHKGLESKAERASAFLAYPRLTVAVDQHGLYGSTAHIQWS